MQKVTFHVSERLVPLFVKGFHDLTKKLNGKSSIGMRLIGLGGYRGVVVRTTYYEGRLHGDNVRRRTPHDHFRTHVIIYFGRNYNFISHL